MSGYVATTETYAPTKSLKSHSLALQTLSEFLAELNPLLCVSFRSIPPLHAPLCDRIVIEHRPGTKVRDSSQTAEYISDIIRSGYPFRKGAVPPIQNTFHHFYTRQIDVVYGRVKSTLVSVKEIEGVSL